MPFHYINVGHYVSYLGSRFQEFYAEKWCATKSKNLQSTFPKVTNITSNTSNELEGGLTKHELSQMQCCYFTASPYSVARYSVT